MDNPGLTWKEAEELYPECSAAWDRDVGDLYHPVLHHMHVSFLRRRDQALA